MTIELTEYELSLIIKGLTTGQFHMAEHNHVYNLVTRLRALFK